MLAIVIDDSRVIRMILRKALVSLGFQVVEASNGQEGLDLLQTHGGAAVALVDWRMPVMDGLEFLRAVRTERGWDEVRLLMVTSEAVLGRITEALEAGADEYLMKPFDEEGLREKLQILGAIQASVA